VSSQARAFFAFVLPAGAPTDELFCVRGDLEAVAGDAANTCISSLLSLLRFTGTNIRTSPILNIRFQQHFRLSLELTRPFNILDIGSGAGNSVIPLLELCPNSFVIAADLSVELLVLLREALQERGLGHRCGLLQLNVEELDFEESSFDIVVGAAVLHHLFASENTIADCARVLKKGGHAIFFEPFENGNMILRIAYEAILGDPRSAVLSADVVKFLRAVIDSFEIRKGRDKNLPIYHNLDDKRLFTPRYFRELSERCNFLRYIMYPMHSTERQFENQTLSYLRLETGKGREALPDWAWKTIQRYDSAFSDDVKSDLLIEGSIIMEK